MLIIRFMVLILTLLVPSAAFAAAGEEEIIETITLQPKEKREVSVASAEKRWNHTDSSAASKCQGVGKTSGHCGPITGFLAG